jgi:hypothetical protein
MTARDVRRLMNRLRVVGVELVPRRRSSPDYVAAEVLVRRGLAEWADNLPHVDFGYRALRLADQKR